MSKDDAKHHRPIRLEPVILEYLAASGPAKSIYQLKEGLGKDYANIYRAVIRLKEKRLVEKLPSGLWLTPRGVGIAAETVDPLKLSLEVRKYLTGETRDAALLLCITIGEIGPRYKGMEKVDLILKMR